MNNIIDKIEREILGSKLIYYRYEAIRDYLLKKYEGDDLFVRAVMDDIQKDLLLLSHRLSEITKSLKKEYKCKRKKEFL